MKKNLASYPDRFVTCVLPSEAGLFQLRNTTIAVLYVTVSCSDVILHYDCMSFGGSKFFFLLLERYGGVHLLVAHGKYMLPRVPPLRAVIALTERH